MNRSVGAGRWSMVLLALAVSAAVSVSMTWVRARGAPVPDSANLAAAQADRPGTVENVQASGVDTAGGAILIAAVCLLVVLALWRVSPRYRPARAGYAVIVAGAVAGATVLWFLIDKARVAAAVGRSMDLSSESVQVTAWPRAALAVFALICVAGVAVVGENGGDVASRKSIGTPQDC